MTLTLLIFLIFVGAVLGISFWLGRSARSSQGYFAAHGQIPWFVNGIAFAGDYLSAASFLGICGMIAFYGYDGFLYSIGFLAGWIVALFVIAEPLKRLGRYTFADALDSQFHSRGITLTAAISTLVVSVFYLIPQMVGAGALIKPLLGWEHWHGVVSVGAVVTIIVVTAGMVSTTWVQFIKGSLLVLFCAILTVFILLRGLKVDDAFSRDLPRPMGAVEVLPGKPFLRDPGGRMWRQDAEDRYSQVQWMVVGSDGAVEYNGVAKSAGGKLSPVGSLTRLPDGQTTTGALNPEQYLTTLQDSEVLLWTKEVVKAADGRTWTFWSQKPTAGAKLLTPGQHPLFKGIQGELPVVDPAKPETAAAHTKALLSRIDFLSLMLALFCGTASLPHILIRYYTVKDQQSARKSTVVGIAAIGFFYVLTLFIGLAAMTSGALDLTDSNTAAPLMARTFGDIPFAIISAIAFTTVLGTVAGLIMASAGAIVHDLLGNVFKAKLSDVQQVRAGKLAAVAVGVVAMWLGIQFSQMNVSFLVAWAFNLAASANLPALVMLLFWKRTTKQGITWAIVVGLVSALAWVLLSKEAFVNVYGLTADRAVVPFSQPAIITVPLGFLVLVVVSLLTPRRAPLIRG